IFSSSFIGDKLSSITFFDPSIIFSISSDAKCLLTSSTFSQASCSSRLLSSARLTCNVSCKIISSALSTVGTGAGGVRRVDLLLGRRKRIIVDHFGALDSAISILGLGDLGVLGVCWDLRFDDYKTKYA
ncbi:hypothetical protein Tco_0416203, partial [Tanacetum coccineum]